MKLTIDIPDDLIMTRIRQAVEAEIAKTSDTMIHQKIDEVLEVKFSRHTSIDKVVEQRVDLMIRAEVKAALDAAFGNNAYSQRERLKEIVSEAARKMLRGS